MDLQKLWNTAFLAFLFLFALKTYGTLKMLPSTQNNFYIILSSYVEGHVQKKFNFEFHFFGWFPGLQNLDFCFEKFLWSYFGNHFQAEIAP